MFVCIISVRLLRFTFLFWVHLTFQFRSCKLVYSVVCLCSVFWLTPSTFTYIPCEKQRFTPSLFPFVLIKEIWFSFLLCLPSTTRLHVVVGRNELNYFSFLRYYCIVSHYMTLSTNDIVGLCSHTQYFLPLKHTLLSKRNINSQWRTVSFIHMHRLSGQ